MKVSYSSNIRVKIIVVTLGLKRFEVPFDTHTFDILHPWGGGDLDQLPNAGVAKYSVIVYHITFM